MNEFRDNLLARIAQAEEAVRLAEERQDTYAAETHGADLANLRRLAAEHGVEPEPEAEPEVEHGVE